jgi:N-acetylglutamate synthase-like GNAT family acetyltransferase
VATVGADTTVAGAIGLENVGDVVLLRSLVVTAENRGTGIESALVRQIIASATAGGAQCAWLLTETAASFLARFGFEVVGRESTRPTVQGSVNFREACPASVTCMVRALTGEFWDSGSAVSQRRDVTGL